MIIPEKLKIGDIFKSSTVFAINAIIDCLREIKGARGVAETSRRQAGPLEDTPFLCTKVLMDDGNEGIAVNGGELTIVGDVRQQHRFIFEPREIPVVDLPDGSAYLVAIVYRKLGSTTNWQWKYITCDYNAMSSLYCNCKGYNDQFCHWVASFKKSTETIPGDPPTTKAVINSMSQGNSFWHSTTIQAQDGGICRITLSLPKINDDTIDGTFIKFPDDFAAATIKVEGAWGYMLDVNSNATYYTAPTATIAHPASLGSSFSGLEIVNTGSSSDPSFEVQYKSSASMPRSIFSFSGANKVDPYAALKFPYGNIYLGRKN